MKCRLLAVLVIGLLLAAADQKEEAVQAELKKLAGTWNVVSMERAGQKAPEEQLKAIDLRIVIQGNKLSAQAGKATSESTFVIDPGKQPRTIDTTDRNNKLEKGIYRLEGDLLTICTSETGGERPTEFATKAGVAQLMFVLKRSKP